MTSSEPTTTFVSGPILIWYVETASLLYRGLAAIMDPNEPDLIQLMRGPIFACYFVFSIFLVYRGWASFWWLFSQKSPETASSPPREWWRVSVLRQEIEKHIERPTNEGRDSRRVTQVVSGEIESPRIVTATDNPTRTDQQQREPFHHESTARASPPKQQETIFMGASWSARNSSELYNQLNGAHPQSTKWTGARRDPRLEMQKLKDDRDNARRL